MDDLTFESLDALDHVEFSLDNDGELFNPSDMTEEEEYFHSLVDAREEER
jgi:hypothetical protein